MYEVFMKICSRRVVCYFGLRKHYNWSNSYSRSAAAERNLSRNHLALPFYVSHILGTQLLFEFLDPLLHLSHFGLPASLLLPHKLEV